MGGGDGIFQKSLNFKFGDHIGLQGLYRTTSEIQNIRQGGGSSLFWKKSTIFPFFNYEISPQGVSCLAKAEPEKKITPPKSKPSPSVGQNASSTNQYKPLSTTPNQSRAIQSTSIFNIGDIIPANICLICFLSFSFSYRMAPRIKKLMLQKLKGRPKNLGIHPVGHFGGLKRPFFIFEILIEGMIESKNLFGKICSRDPITQGLKYFQTRLPF